MAMRTNFGLASGKLISGRTSWPDVVGVFVITAASWLAPPAVARRCSRARSPRSCVRSAAERRRSVTRLSGPLLDRLEAPLGEDLEREQRRGAVAHPSAAAADGRKHFRQEPVSSPRGSDAASGPRCTFSVPTIRSTVLTGSQARVAASLDAESRRAVSVRLAAGPLALAGAGTDGGVWTLPARGTRQAFAPSLRTTDERWIDAVGIDLALRNASKIYA